MMIRKYGSIGLSILVLAGIIIGTALWIRLFSAGIQNYRSPLREVELPVQPDPAVHTTQVVLVLVSGLGYDDAEALALPVLEQLKQAGATAAIQSIPPTYSQTAWGSLITGAPPTSNDAPPINLALSDLHPLEIDTLFDRARQANLETALLGAADWERLVPGNLIDYTFFVDQPGPAADQAIFEAALPLVESHQYNFTMIQFTQVDFAARQSGDTASETYRQAAFRVDSYLAQLSGAMDLNHSALVVLSDHGHIPDGGHGGNEVEVIWQPLVMIGETVIPGTYSDVSQLDIAPTIATLLGLSVPNATQGRVLFEMLELSEETQAGIQLAIARQRLELLAAYLAQIQGEETMPSEQLETDVARAQTALANDNISGGLQLATLAQEEANAQLAIAIQSRLRKEQLARLVVAGLILFIWFFVMWRRRGFHAGSVVVAAIISVALYHSLFQLQGYSYSFSSAGALAELPIQVARLTAFSMLVGGGLILILLMLTREDHWLTLLGTGYGYGMLVTFMFALPVLWAFWQNGLWATWHLPDVGPAFWQFTGLFQVMVAAILALLLPWPIMTLNLVVSLVRHYLGQTRSKKPDALPGLHL